MTEKALFSGTCRVHGPSRCPQFYAPDRIACSSIRLTVGRRPTFTWSASGEGLNSGSVRFRIYALVEQHEQQLLKAWHEFFTN